MLCSLPLQEITHLICLRFPGSLPFLSCIGCIFILSLSAIPAERHLVTASVLITHMHIYDFALCTVKLTQFLMLCPQILPVKYSEYLSVPRMCQQQVRLVHSHFLCEISHISSTIVLEKIHFFQPKMSHYFFSVIGKTVILSTTKESWLWTSLSAWERSRNEAESEILIFTPKIIWN